MFTYAQKENFEGGGSLVAPRPSFLGVFSGIELTSPGLLGTFSPVSFIWVGSLGAQKEPVAGESGFFDVRIMTPYGRNNNSIKTIESIGYKGQNNNFVQAAGLWLLGVVVTDTLATTQIKAWSGDRKKFLYHL